MPSEIVGQRSFYFDEMRFPAEKQTGFRKGEPVAHNHHGMDRILQAAESKSFVSSPIGSQLVGSLEHPHSSYIRGSNAKFSLEGTNNLPSGSWISMDQSLGVRSNMFVKSASHFVEGTNGVQYENGLFSSSLSDMFSKKLRLLSNDVPFGQSVDAMASHYDDGENFESLKEIEAQTIGSLLPDDDLLSGVFDDLEYIAQPNGVDDMEEFDLFSSGGGMELEGDRESKRNADANREFHGGADGAFAGEQPNGEQPSRTLFVRNINSNIDDSELKALFEQYGDIRTLYTACNRGFVMICYYDIRASCNAMRALQHKPLRRRKLDIHFSIPKDNPSERDVNQGTLVVFNLDSSVSNDYLRQVFGIYGEIKEIRETPYKRHHKFIEYYDIRAAEAALRALNRTDIAGKRIKLEASRPGGARRLLQQLSPELEHEETEYRLHGTPPNDSTFDRLEAIVQGMSTSSCMENGSIHGIRSRIRTPLSQLDNGFHQGIPSIPNSLPSHMTVGSHGNKTGLGELAHSLNQMKFGFQCLPTFQPHSLPEYHDGLAHGAPYNSSGSMARSIGSRPSSDGIANRHIQGHVNGHPIELNELGYGSSVNGNHSLHQHAWNNSTAYHSHSPSSMMLANSSSFISGVNAHQPQQLHGLSRASSHLMNTSLSMHHHIGSAPTMNNSIWERKHSYAGESSDAFGFQAGSLGNTGLSGTSPMHHFSPNSMFLHGGANCMDSSISSSNIGLHSPQQKGHMFPGRSTMLSMPNSYDPPNERVRSRRNEANSNQADSKKQYDLNLDRILHGEETRTTLMIKNIPNKYTSKMLLAAIDERHRGTYDFIYLPIDFKNKCNVGYAFINMIDPLQIVPFYQSFNGKKWEKFNSEKVASLAYARIQGKTALVSHFQNSSLMNEDKRCRPILFHSDGPNAGDQEPFPMGVNIRPRMSRMRTNSNDDNHHGSPSNSGSGEEYSNGTDSSSAKDLE